MALEGLDDVEFDEVSLLRRKLNGLHRDYNKKREILYYKIMDYYKQSIASTYVKEDDILDLINSCRSIKEQYLEKQQEIMDKRPDDGRPHQTYYNVGLGYKIL